MDRPRPDSDTIEPSVVPQRIGVYGGTFDPIHYGHLAVAAEACWALDLDHVLFVVAAQQPLKRDGHAATADQRLAMVRLACANNPCFVPCDIELRRPPPSYTVETLRELRSSADDSASFWFIIGVDALNDIHRWHGAAELIMLVRLAAIERPGVELDLEALERRLPGITSRVDRIKGPRLDIASSDVRARRAAGRPVRYQIPDSVLAFIDQHDLYPVEDE